MDTITHGIAGALIGKAVFRGEDMFASHPMSSGRIITWSLMLGAIFPDSDVIRDFFSSDKLLIVTWHRSLTHSVVMLPLWALLLAGITYAFARWRKWETPSFIAVTGIYAAGIISHILLDLVTTFGTMIWSPLNWSRPAWDLIFIVDFTLTAVFLVPQLLAWVYAHPEKMRRRAVGMWLVFLPAPLLIARIGEIVGAPISGRTVLGAMIVFAAVFLLPSLFGWGLKIRHDKWNRAGLVASLAYIALAVFAHRAALARIHKFAELDHLQVQSIGALPLPPSVWRWDGLVRTERGVYELRMDISDKQAPNGNLLALEHRYYPDAFPNSYTEAARRLPEVQKVLWFARFPVTRFHKEGNEAVVEISDLRFARGPAGHPPPFTYGVRFDSAGNVISQGWVKQ
ncbi:MAG TPA: metal-dependent hydrolase [Candidatus Acidoferrum sp.]|nr:metal-dependent hydrolase [Candidatus Acidoferrum sp.]